MTATIDNTQGIISTPLESYYPVNTWLRYRYFARASYQELDMGDFITRYTSAIIELQEGFTLKDVAIALKLEHDHGVDIIALSKL
jgi:hypothetical protein